MRLISTKLYALLLIGASASIVAAIIGQLNSSMDRTGFSPFNFFSYFTILSNIFIAIIFAVFATKLFCNRKPGTFFETLRGATTVYMVTTGIVYALLLSGYDVQVTEPWVNFILHQLMPIVAALSWLLIAPAARLSKNIWLGWLAFPVAYAAYTLVRGPIVDWYPYPFFDPNKPGGYWRVAGYCFAITIFMLLLVVTVGWAGNRLNKKTTTLRKK